METLEQHHTSILSILIGSFLCLEVRGQREKHPDDLLCI